MTTSVQTRIDIGGIDGIPHTFLVVTHPNGSTTEYGFLPAIPLTPSSIGHVAITGVPGVKAHESHLLPAPKH